MLTMRQRAARIIANKKAAVGQKKTRVCVLTSSYAGSDSPTAAVDDFHCSPEPWLKKTAKRYTFDEVAVEKAGAFRHIRELVSSGRYDVFYNLCDGAKDEKRAGEEVVRALEGMNAAYTGADADHFEPNKVEMKVMVSAAGSATPNFVLVDSTRSIGKACKHLRFPVIVKHQSGYASVGITKDSKCNNAQELKAQCKRMVKEFDHALVEEFITGKEGTVLVCADPKSPSGIKVFPPIMLTFLKDENDFAHFDNKWVKEWEYRNAPIMGPEDPALEKVQQMARNAFRHVMGGCGYGRVDFRIDSRTGDPYFLEINPNCGMLYHPDTGGDYADVMVMEDKDWDHDQFIGNAIKTALRQQAAKEPWYSMHHDANGNFVTKAKAGVRPGTLVFNRPQKPDPVPVITQALYRVPQHSPPHATEGVTRSQVGCLVKRGDGHQQMVILKHHCDPNLTLLQGKTLMLCALRDIREGEELTIDFGMLRDEDMPNFSCDCGAVECRRHIVAGMAMPRMDIAPIPRPRTRAKKVDPAQKAEAAAATAAPAKKEEAKKDDGKKRRDVRIANATAKVAKRNHTLAPKGTRKTRSRSVTKASKKSTAASKPDKSGDSKGPSSTSGGSPKPTVRLVTTPQRAPAMKRIRNTAAAASALKSDAAATVAVAAA